MTKLDWNIGRVNDHNDALITGAVKDVSTIAERTASQLMNTVSPSAFAVFDNTATLVRKPFTTIGTPANYGKLAKTIPAIPMDIAMKSVRLPFSRIDDAMNYVVNNNLERVVAGAKSLTTGLVANLITNNGHTRFTPLKYLGTAIEGAGDLIGTVIKAPTGLLAKGTSIVDQYMGKGSIWTENFVNSVRISDKNFIEKNPIVNSADMPEAANDNRPPSDKTPVEHKEAA